MRVITMKEVQEAAASLASKLPRSEALILYGVPRGGVAAVLALAMQMDNAVVSDNPEHADVIVDDIIDLGTTAKRYRDQGKQFVALFSKTDEGEPTEFKVGFALGRGEYVQFPWEASDSGSNDEDLVRRMLQRIGEDPNREGLLETPKRVLKAWDFWFKGYKENPADLMKVFEDGAEEADEMVIVKDIDIFSHCEHHIAPIIGKCHIAYIPNKRIIGISKLARLAEVFARRLQVQERLTNQIASAIQEHLEPLAVGVIIEAQHTCMTSRGIQKVGTATVTSALRGCFKDEPSARAEFMRLCGY